MYISNISLSSFKSFKQTSHITNPSKNINIIVGKNGSGKSNLITAISTLFTPNRILTEEKQNLINEGHVLTQKEAKISVTISENERFPFNDTFTLSRVFDLKRDEYEYKDGADFEIDPANEDNNKENENENENKHKTNTAKSCIQKDEMKGLFESVNLLQNFFIVQQGKINHLSYLDDFERYELIKEIAGASVYERDRMQSIELLQESKTNEEKICNTLKSVNERIKDLCKERERYMEYERLENEKREIENVLYRIEKNKIEKELEELEMVEESESDIEDIKDEVYELEKAIQEKEREMREKGREMNGNIALTDATNIYVSDINLDNVYVSGTNPDNVYVSDTNPDNTKKNNDTLSNVTLCKNKLINLCNSMQKKIEKYNLESIKTKIEMCAVNHEKEFSKSNDIEKIKEMMHDYKKYNFNNHSGKSLQFLVEEKNRLWVDMKRNEKDMKKSIEDYKRLENILLKSETSQFRVYQEIKDCKGVHGCVFEVLNIEEDLFTALESCAGSNLFNVIVDDEEIVNELMSKISGRITFLPLNRFNSYKNVNECDNNDAHTKNVSCDNSTFYPLSDKIKCKNLYKPLLNYITKDSFLVSDNKNGVLLSKKYNKNCVTFDGDFISKNGFIKGGYKKKESAIFDIKNKENEIKKVQKNVKEIENKIKEVENEIKMVKCMKDNNEEYKEIKKKGLELFFSRINSNKKCFSDKKNAENTKNQGNYNVLLNDLNVKNTNIENEIKNTENELKEILKKIKNCENEINKINLEKEKENIKRMRKELEIKKDKIRKRENVMDDIENKNVKNRIKMRRGILIEKQINLNKKIGYIKDDNYSDNEDTYSKHYNDDTYHNTYKMKLNDVNGKLKKYIGVNKKVNLQYNEFVSKKDELNKRIADLKDGRVKIEEFISVLDDKKNDAVKVTLSMVKNNFEYFYYKLTGKKGELILNDDKIEIKIENEKNIKKLSGGEKTILSLSLIFSIQKIDSSPFYFFDEIDANLDKDARKKVGELIKEMCNENTQYFIVTFRKEMIEIGDRFYGIEYVNRNSEIKEICKEDAIAMTIED